MNRRFLIAAVPLLLGAAACGSSSATDIAAPAQAATTVVETTTSVLVTTTAAPTTTMAPTTTTEALPVLGTFDEIKTLPEAKALLATSQESVPMPADQPISDVIAAALDQVVAGTLAPKDFFAATDSTVEPGVILGTYLICNVETFFDPKCTASVKDFSEYMTPCEESESATIIEHISQNEERWAAVATCIWRPTEAELSKFAADAGKALENDTNSVGATNLEIAILAQRRADYYSMHRTENQSLPETPESDALLSEFLTTASESSGGCSSKSFSGLVQGLGIDFASDDAIPYEGNFDQVGLGATINGGYLFISYCWFG
jgi:hypothetical protein